MSLSDFFHRLWYGKPKYTPEERLLNQAKARRAGLIKHLTTFLGINGSLLALNYISNGFTSFWAWIGWVAAIWGGMLAISGMRYFFWRNENKEDLVHAERKVRAMRKAELNLLERSARSRSITERVSPDELYRLAKEQAQKAKEVAGELGAEYSELPPLIERNLKEVRKMTDYLKNLEQYLAEEDLGIITKEQKALEKRIAETKDKHIQKELGSSLEMLGERANRLKELQVESDRIRARIQSFQQSIEGLRAEVTRIKTAEVQEQPVAAMDDMSDSVKRLKRELETMKKVREELDGLNISDESLQASLKELRAQKQRGGNA